MDISPSIESLSHKTIKQKFMRWAWKWYYGDIIAENSEKPDITQLICLLQSIGFQLRQFEKSNDENVESNDSNNLIKVILECGTSKMKATLNLEDVTCQCPNSQDTSVASFWSVSGTARKRSTDNISKFEESGSNLLPRLSKNSYRVIHDVMHSLLNIINNKMNINHSTDESVGINTSESISKDDYDTNKSVETPNIFTRCYTQPEMVTFLQRNISLNNNNTDSNSSENINKYSSAINLRSSVEHLNNLFLSNKKFEDNQKVLKLTISGMTITNLRPFVRQQTFTSETDSNESEPRSSPPKITSSLGICGELCASFDRVSLPSDESSLTITECLQYARYYIEKAESLQTNIQLSSITPSHTLSLNTTKGSDSQNKSTPRSRLPCATSHIRSTISSAAKSTSCNVNLVKNIGPNVNTRRIIGSNISKGSIGTHSSVEISKVSKTEHTLPMTAKLPVRGQTVNNLSSTLKLAVTGARDKVATTKPKSTRSTTLVLNSNRNQSMLVKADSTRVNSSDNKRISLNSTGGLHIYTENSSTVNTPTTTRGSSNIGMITSKSNLNSQKQLSGINSNIRRSISQLPRYGLSKK